MRVQAGRSGNELLFFLVALLACPLAVVATFRLAAGVSSAQVEETDSTVRSDLELRALARQATLRVAARSCGNVTRGSGFIVGDWLLTNEHVVRGAAELKADQPIDPVIIPIAGHSVLADLAAAPAPAGMALALADTPAGVGDTVLVAGHADGGAIEVRQATVANRVPGAAFGFGSDVLLVDVQTRGGYSGGPVLDRDGNVVAILSGFDRSTELSVAVPSDHIALFLDGLADSAAALVTEGCPDG